MLKKRILNHFEQQRLYEMMSHPEVLPFVRHKAYSLEEFTNVNRETIEAELRGELISRVILDAYEQPAGTINLFDIHGTSGFLATWLGKEYQGKGLNQMAKSEFLYEVFTTTSIDTVYMCIRNENIRSQRAAMKLPYVSQATAASWAHFETVRQDYAQFQLLQVNKEDFLRYNEQVVPFIAAEAMEVAPMLVATEG